MDAFIDLFINFPMIALMYLIGGIGVIVFAYHFIKVAFFDNPDGCPRR